MKEDTKNLVADWQHLEDFWTEHEILETKLFHSPMVEVVHDFYKNLPMVQRGGGCQGIGQTPCQAEVQISGGH